MANTKLMQLIADDIERYKDSRKLVHASLFERLFKRSIPLSELHPNPDDEFAEPSIGPNGSIISEYTEKIKEYQRWQDDIFPEPILVQKMKPDGYMIINGHHRWAAAVQMGIPKIHAAIVNPRYVPDYSSDSQTGGES